MGTTLRYKSGYEDSIDEVSYENPLGVYIPDGMVVTTGQQTRSWSSLIPGIGTGSAYASGDQFGVPFQIVGVARGPGMGFAVASAVFLDYDNEGKEKEVWFFSGQPSSSTDNGAYAPSAADLDMLLGMVDFASFKTFSANQASVISGAGLYGVTGSSSDIWAVCVTRGADNIAVGAIPRLRLVFSVD